LTTKPSEKKTKQILASKSNRLTSTMSLFSWYLFNLFQYGWLLYIFIL